MKGYRSTLIATPFKVSKIAQYHAEKRFPGIVWGAWHQGPNGRMRIVGRVPGTENDPVIIEKL